jgi:hypothetical protein
MNFQGELRRSKKTLRTWVRTHFSDQQLASVAAFNADGQMSFRHPCGCLLGVTYSDPLHTDAGCSQEHYQRARQEDRKQTSILGSFFSSRELGQVERAYLFLGFTQRFHDCFGDDEVRRRRLAALLRAEMRYRSRQSRFLLDEPVNNAYEWAGR